MMKELNISIMLTVAFLVAGCATHRVPPMANSRETLSLVITRGQAAREYTVQATVATVSSSVTLPPSLVGGTNATDLLHCAGHAEVLSAPRITVAAGQWAEVRVCSTNTPGTFAVSTQMGQEKISVAHSAGVLFRVKVEAIPDGLVRVQGILSLGSEDTNGNICYHRVMPFLTDCILDTPTVVFAKEHAIPNMPTGKCETIDGTTNACTLPSRSRGGK